MRARWGQLRRHVFSSLIFLSAGSEHTLVVLEGCRQHHVAASSYGVGFPPYLAAEFLCFDFQESH